MAHGNGAINIIQLSGVVGITYKSHAWHGISSGGRVRLWRAPAVVAFCESCMQISAASHKKRAFASYSRNHPCLKALGMRACAAG